MAFSFNNSGASTKARKQSGAQAVPARRSAVAGKGESLKPASQSAAARVTAEKAVARRRKADAAAATSGPSAPSGAQAPTVGFSPVSSAEGSGARPTRRSARGSETVAREKEERKFARKASRDGRMGAGAARSAGATASVKGSARASRTSGATADTPRSARDSATQRALMKYAADNRVVTWLYDLTTGPRKYFFYGVVVLLVLAGVYAPVKDFYVAFRTEQILQEQNAIRNAYNETLGKEVEGLLSEEGVEDKARKDFGMVMPGEQTITVEGLDEEGNPVTVDTSAESSDGEGGADANGNTADPSAANGAASKNEGETLKGADAANKDSDASASASAVTSGDTPKTSAEAEAAERAVLENSAWYWKVLDTLFGFTGTDGMAIVSTGEQK